MDRDTEVIREFLERGLPPELTEHAAYIAEAVLEAGLRYDRYTARKKEWLKYTTRKDRLQGIAKLADELVSGLSALDILSLDDLAERVGSSKIEELVGSLTILSSRIKALVREVQKDGRPRELAEERWLAQMADIYENAFGQPARVAGSGSGPVEKRGRFYRFLEVGRPKSFARYGKLSPRQVERSLNRTKPKGAPSLSQFLAPYYQPT